MPEETSLHAEVRQTEGLTFVARGRTSHWVVLDTSEAGGGHAGASNPMELLLMALGGCTGMDIVAVLTKMQQQFTAFRVELTGERAVSHPRRFTRINVDCILTSDTVAVDDAVKAIRLSAEKYCSVGATLAPGVELVYHYRIIRSSREDAGSV